MIRVLHTSPETAGARALILVRIAAVVCVVLGTSAVARTQSAIVVQGRVTDAATGQPLTGVGVAISGWGDTRTRANGQSAIAAQQGIRLQGGLSIQTSGYFFSTPSYDLSGGTP